MWDVQDDALQALDEETRQAQQRVDDLLTLKPIGSITGHDKPSRTVGFNPRTLMIATGAGELAFWLPEKVDGATSTGASAVPISI
ncbi:hypothetical protein [Phaffia rhodozyma]|uniref:WD40/YVTN repeat-like-containing domain n=1 Tax=Phaffia rhodozyma TaxID=264483 RepID=A0A0F7STV4_PHARH|nr:hypothetical protein [Phaffia rhodozyma]